MVRSADPLRYALEELVSPSREAIGDAELLRRFAETVDQAAFAELVRRHGRLVLGTARRILDHPQDAEDVFQATFLVLARKASGLGRVESVAGLLHGIAWRIARKQRAVSARRSRCGYLGARPERIEDGRAAQESRWEIDEQLERLPEALRLPVILCLLEGQSQEQAAQQLGCLPRTLKDRLRRGKDLLRDRLGQAGVIAAGMETLAGVPAPTASLIEATARLSALFAEGLADEGAVVALARGGLWAMSISRIKAVAAVLLVLTCVGVGAGVLMGGMPVQDVQKAAPPAVRKDLYGDPLPDSVLVRLGTVRYRHPSLELNGLGVSSDGRTVVTADRAGYVRVWEAASGRCARVSKVDFYLTGFALSADGKRIALTGYRRGGGQNETIFRVEETATGKVVRTWQREEKDHGESKVAFTPDGRKVASLGTNGVLRLEDIATDTEVVRLELPRRRLDALIVSNDGATVAVAAWRTITLWRWQEAGKPREIDVLRGLTSLSFSPDDKYLAAGDEDESGVRIWEVETGKQAQTLGAGSGCKWVRFSPDGKYVVGTGRTEKALIVWDAATGKEVHRLGGPKESPELPACTGDSRRLVAHQEGVLRIWDVATGKEMVAFADSHSKAPHFVRLEGNVAITAADDGSVRFWDVRTGQQTRRIEAPLSWTGGAAMSPDGRWLATSGPGRGNAIGLWDVQTGKRVYQLAGKGKLAFSRDGKRLASWGEDQYLRVWDVKTGKAIEEHAIAPDGQGGPFANEREGLRERVERSLLERAAFTSDARLLALSRGAWMYLFDVQSGEQKGKAACEGGSRKAIAFSPDNRTMVTVASGRGRLVVVQGKQDVVHDNPMIRMYDVASAVLTKTIKLPKGTYPEVIAYRPDGKRFAVTVTAEPPTIRQFDDEGNDCGTIVLPGRAWSLAYSTDGKRLIAGLGDTTAVILEVPTR